jgi:hypothetical protein
MASPIQIVLNAENYDVAREPGSGGPKTDFFAHRDREFEQHKANLIFQLEAVAKALRNQPDTDIGHLKVILRREAWAKSHRPVNALFKRERTPLVGGGDLGVMVVEVQPRALMHVAAEIEAAENQTTMRFNKTRGKEVPYPSARRSEAGAILKIELYGPADRRAFSVEESVAWLSNPMTGSGYQVELFELPPPRSQWDAYDQDRRGLYRSFVEGLASTDRGLTVRPLPVGTAAQPLLSIRLDRSATPPTVLLSAPQTERRREVAPFDDNPDRHTRLLAFLEKHPLVRHIDLPGVVVHSPARTGRVRPDVATIPVRNAARTYPVVGVIDSGIGPCLSDWVIDRWDVLADEDADHAHGTFIGGLAVLGGSLNGADTCAEPDGAALVDVAVFPSEQNVGAFASYYPDGLPQFFDEVGTAVAELRARQGARVFNMSLNVLRPAAPDRYSIHAARLDQIAEANDALIFISAGNVDAQDLRPEWAADMTEAIASLAAAQNDEILTPAESVRNVSVAAVNPPSCLPCVAFAPTRFSRRGPGLRAGVKPDLAHVGGTGSPSMPLGHALFSITPGGLVIDGCGTSYATPLVAKTAAIIDHAIEGQVSRETIIALLVHNSEIPVPLQGKSLATVARHMVGFGIPRPCARMLETGDHEITLVFASRIRRDEQMTFRFSWPASLVSPDGKCRGAAKLTIVSTPPLNQRFGAEFVRVNVDAALQQEHFDKDGNSRWRNRLDPLYLPGRGDWPVYEAERIEHGLKWSPVKMYGKRMPLGVGPSSNWRLQVSYLTRAGEEMTEEGVPFTAVLTISDLAGERPVFNEMRQMLTSLGVRIADIRTAARITPRV